MIYEVTTNHIANAKQNPTQKKIETKLRERYAHNERAHSLKIVLSEILEVLNSK